MKWAPIPGFPGYEISDRGDLRSCRQGRTRLLRPFTTPDGYLRIKLQATDGRRVGELVHGLVLAAFVAERPAGADVEARHLDGVKTNNTPENLVWGTRRENGQDKVRHGTSQRGEANVQAKLSRAQALEIRGSSESNYALARRFGVSHETIRNIRNGEKWAWLSDHH
jgi:hypothetical protein